MTGRRQNLLTGNSKKSASQSPLPPKREGSGKTGLEAKGPWFESRLRQAPQNFILYTLLCWFILFLFFFLTVKFFLDFSMIIKKNLLYVQKLENIFSNLIELITFKRIFNIFYWL